MSWLYVAVGVGTAAAGYFGSQSTQRGNEKLSAQARQDEINRRGAASEELNKAFAAYEKLRSERKGIKFEDWRNEYAKGLQDEQLQQMFREIKEEDFQFASGIARQGTQQNIQNWAQSAQDISGGKAKQLLDIMNETALTDTTEAAYNRALELESGKIPAGSVQYDKDGRLIRGQRADKQLFTTAYEVGERQRDIQFRRARDLFGDYSDIALRQQEKARDYLPDFAYEPVVRELSSKAMESQLKFQMQDEMNQFQLIRDFAASAMGNQTANPQFADAGQYNQLISKGIDIAVKGAANSQNSNSTTPSRTTTPSYT